MTQIASITIATGNSVARAVVQSLVVLVDDKAHDSPPQTDIGIVRSLAYFALNHKIKSKTKGNHPSAIRYKPCFP